MDSAEADSGHALTASLIPPAACKRGIQITIIVSLVVTSPKVAVAMVVAAA